MRENGLTSMLPWALGVGVLAVVWPVTHGWLALLVAMAALAVASGLVAGTLFDVTVARAPAQRPRLRPCEHRHDGSRTGPMHPWAA